MILSQIKKKKIAFVCVENSCRSQIAEALANKLCNSSNLEFLSAGTNPAGEIDPKVLEILQKEEDIIWRGRPKFISNKEPIDICPYDYRMAKIKRKIIRIDEEKCDGCGLCIPVCPEGALQIVDGKAKLVKENFCDGLGACLGDCPQGALTIEEREVEEYDEEGVIAHIREKSPELLEKHLKHLKEHAHELPSHHSHPKITSCPSAQMLHWEKKEREVKEEAMISSELCQWPIQLHLVPSHAPYFQNADLILVADCVPFAYANFHTNFLKGKAIAIGCPKLDDVDAYIEKIEQIIENSDIKSLKVIHMEVPCCYGLVHITKEALRRSGKNIPFEAVIIGIKGEVIEMRVAQN